MAQDDGILGRWRNGIRLSETAVVIGLWAGAVTAADAVIAQLLFVVGFLIGAVAIFADPRGSRATSLVLVLLLALVCLAGDAIFMWRHSLTPTEQRQPLLSRADVADLLKDALAKPQVQPPAPVRTAPRRPDRVIITVQEPRAAEPPPMPTPLASDDAVANIYYKKLVRSRAGSEARSQCVSEITSMQSSLNRLVRDAVDIQNRYANGGTAANLQAESANWNYNVEMFFLDNLARLPNYGIVRDAQPDKPTRTFLGINKNGMTAWSLLGAKREALDKVASSVGYDTCEAAKQAAIAKCIAEGRC